MGKLPVPAEDQKWPYTHRVEFTTASGKHAILDVCQHSETTHILYTLVVLPGLA